MNFKIIVLSVALVFMANSPVIYASEICYVRFEYLNADIMQKARRLARPLIISNFLKHREEEAACAPSHWKCNPENDAAMFALMIVDSYFVDQLNELIISALEGKNPGLNNCSIALSGVKELLEGVDINLKMLRNIK